MNSEVKVKVLDALKESQPTCFTKENVYKCSNDGMVCFNGFVAELVNGNKYELEQYWDQAWDRAYEAAQEYILDDVKSQLRNESLFDEISEEEQNRIIDNRYQDAIDQYEPEVETSEVAELAADEIIQDLNGIYDSNNTHQEINELHHRWTIGEIDFDVAMAELERLIVENE